MNFAGINGGLNLKDGVDASGRRAKVCIAKFDTNLIRK